jgi:S1-C subfamily serine protease
LVVAAFAGLLAYSSLSNSGSNSLGSTVTVTKNNIILETTVEQASQQNATVPTAGFDLVAIYKNANESIVTVMGDVSSGGVSGEVLGSGMVILYQNTPYIVTNFHVVDSVTNLTVTFWNGDSFPAKLVGSDIYSDLAVVSTDNAPISEYHPISLVPSSTLEVGDTVVAIGNPYGLSGSMTVGIVSQLGRTIRENTTGNYAIASIIQFSAPINPGNSGGALLNANGGVVGITTAAVSGSVGLGFAIPSDTILRELPSLITAGGYTNHPYLGVYTVDMNYQFASAIGTNVTYGVLIEQVAPGGPTDKAGLVGGNKVVTIEGQQYTIGGDIIISINGTRIVNYDSMASYLEENALPKQTVQMGIIHSGSYEVVDVVLGVRPPPS